MNEIPLLSSRWHRCLLLVLCVGSLVPIWSVEYFPSQNGPWHLLTIHMMHEYGNPAFNYREFYQPSIHAIPHLAHTLTVYALAFVFPLLTAHKLVISLYALLLPFSVFWLLATVNRNRMAHGYVSFLLVYNVPLLRGYHDYVLGIPLVILTFTYWLRSRERMTASRAGLLMALIVAVYLSHLFNMLVLGLAMLVYTLHARRAIRPVLQVLLLFLPASLLLAEFAWFSLHNTQWLNTDELEFIAPHANAERFFSNFFFTMSESAYRLVLVSLLLGTPFVVRTIAKAYRLEGNVWYRTIVSTPALTLFLLLVVLFFITPYKLYGWHYVNTRFVPYVIIFGLASLRVAGQTAKRVAVAGVALAALGVYGMMTSRFIEAEGYIDEYLSARSKIARNAVVLPISVESIEIGSIAPLARVFEYYSIFLGAHNGNGIARFNTVTPMVYRTYPIRRRFPRWSTLTGSNIRRIAETYDYVVIWGRDPGAILPRDPFVTIHQDGRLRVLRNESRPDLEASR